MKCWAKVSDSSRWEVRLYHTEEDAKNNRYSFLTTDTNTFGKLTSWTIKQGVILPVELKLRVIPPEGQQRFWPV